MTRILCLLVALTAACRRPEEGTDPTDSTPDPTTKPDPEPTRPDTTTLPTVGEPEWMGALRAAPGVTVVSYSEAVDSTQVYLRFEQPVDHDATSGPTFEQQAILYHRDPDAPVVLTTMGSSLYYGFQSDIGGLVKGNELQLEKRFDGQSRPEDVDWDLLTAEQVAADAHSVVERMQGVYGGPWIGTGHSNGGIDALSHRMFYPDDLAGTVAYVAPALTSLEDPRFHDFFANEADPTCQAAVEKLQVALLTTLWPDFVASAQTQLDSYAYYGYTLTFDRVGGLERSLQLSMIEFPFTFWQYNGLRVCPDVPDPDVDPVAAVEFGTFVAWAANGMSGSDGTLATAEAYFVQVSAYAGYPSIPTTAIDGLVDADLIGAADFYLPEGATRPTFDALAPRLQDWIDTDAEDVILIHGGLDPWSAGALDVSLAGPTVHDLRDPDGDHNTMVDNLGPADRDVVIDALADWAP